jgi:hypothetical protein
MISNLLQLVSQFDCAASYSQSAILAYRMFLDPLPADDYWLVMMLPLVFAIALVYKTIKVDDSRILASQTAYLCFQIVAFMTLAATALWVVGAIV